MIQKAQIRVQGGHSRENNYDLLRLISCIAVVLIHANWEYWGEIAYDQNHTTQWYIGSIINILTRFSVPNFVMLTGAFVMNGKNVSEAVKSNHKVNWMILYCNVSFKTFLPMIISLLIQVTIHIARNVISKTNFINLLKNIITGNFANLWYFYMLAVLYLLIPVVVLIKRSVSYKHYVTLTGVMTIWAIASQATSDQHAFWSIGIVVPYLAYFMLGDILFESIKSQKIKNNALNVLILLLLSIFCLVVTFVVRLNGFNYYLVRADINFFSPTIVIYSICIFTLFGFLKIRINVYLISRYTFMIYVWHTLCMKLIKPFIDSFLLSKGTSICILCILSLFMSAIIGSVVGVMWRFIDKCFNLNSKWQNLMLSRH